MSMTVSANPQAITWGDLLSGVNKASGADAAQAVSDANRSVTFTAEVDGAVTTVTVNIPDDLELPAEVTPEAINALVAKLQGGGFDLTEAQISAIKSAVTSVYNQMATALSTTQSSSTGSVMFDLYQLMALLVEVAQSQRNAARDLRNTQSQQIQNSIQAQADAQRTAAIVGMVLGVTCGVISAVVSAGMLVGQAAAFKTQVSTAQSSGLDAAQNKVTMLQNADTPEHAQAQMAKVESKVGQTVANDVKAKIDSDPGVQAAKAKLDQAVPERQNLETAKSDLAGAKQDAGKARLDAVQDRIAAGVGAEESAQAKYAELDETAQGTPEGQALYKAAQSEKNAEAAELQVQAKEANLRDAEKAYADAAADHPEEVAAYRTALDKAADKYAADYEAAAARHAPRSEINAARNEMRMARAYVNNEIMQDPGLRPTAAEHQAAVVTAKDGVNAEARQLEGNLDYRSAQHRMETFSSINAINTAIGNMLQSMTQSIAGAISSEATRMGAEQQREQEQLDQTKDLFQQAQSVVDAAIQLMNAVAAAEAQSMRDAIQA